VSAPAWATPYSRGLLALNGVLYLGLGLAFALDPVGWAAKVGLSLDAPGPVTEVRAIYGGLELGLGVLFVLCTMRGAWLMPGVVGLLCTYGGLATLRGVSLLGAGDHGDLHPKLLAIELMGTVLSGVAVWGLGYGGGGEAPPPEDVARSTHSG